MWTSTHGSVLYKTSTNIPIIRYRLFVKEFGQCSLWWFEGVRGWVMEVAIWSVDFISR